MQVQGDLHQDVQWGARLWCLLTNGRLSLSQPWAWYHHFAAADILRHQWLRDLVWLRCVALPRLNGCRDLAWRQILPSPVRLSVLVPLPQPAVWIKAQFGEFDFRKAGLKRAISQVVWDHYIRCRLGKSAPIGDKDDFNDIIRAFCANAYNTVNLSLGQ